MTRLSKRLLLKTTACSTLAALAVLAGCSKKEEAPAAPATAAPAKAEPLKIAFAYVGPVGDGGWTYAHDNARKALDKEFGDRIVTSFVEKEPEAAQSMINGGADVLMQNTDSSAVLKTAEKNGKYAFGWDSDMTAYGPKAHLASAVINWTPYYVKATRDALDGKWAADRTWWGVKEGAIDLVSLSDKVPADLKAKVDAARAGLKDGSLVVWKGPIADTDGKEVLAKDAVADDKFLGGIKFYVKGVEGKVPGADK